MSKTNKLGPVMPEYVLPLLDAYAGAISEIEDANENTVGCMDSMREWAMLMAHDCHRIGTVVMAMRKNRDALFAALGLEPDSKLKPLPQPEGRAAFWNGNLGEHGKLGTFTARLTLGALQCSDGSLRMGGEVIPDFPASIMFGDTQYDLNFVNQEPSPTGDPRDVYMEAVYLPAKANPQPERT